MFRLGNVSDSLVFLMFSRNLFGSKPVFKLGKVSDTCCPWSHGLRPKKL